MKSVLRPAALLLVALPVLGGCPSDAPPAPVEATPNPAPPSPEAVDVASRDAEPVPTQPAALDPATDPEPKEPAEEPQVPETPPPALDLGLLDAQGAQVQIEDVQVDETPLDTSGKTEEEAIRELEKRARTEVVDSPPPQPQANTRRPKRRVKKKTRKPREGTGRWHTNYDMALSEAKRRGVPMLVNFTGSDWCGWCIKLKREVFSKPEFQTWARKTVVLLEVDFPRRKQLPVTQQEKNKSLAKRYRVRGYPTIVFVNSQGGRIGQAGYAAGGPKAWIKVAESALGR